MPFSATRDLWLVMKARSEAAGAMRAFSRDIRMVGDSVVEAQLRASRATLQNEMATKRLATAYQISMLRQGQQTASTASTIRALNDEQKAFLLGKQLEINAIDKEIHGLRGQRAATEESRVASQKLHTTLSGLAGVTSAVGTIMLGASALVVFGLGSMVKAQVEYEKQSALTRTQVDKFATSLKDVEEIGLRVADSIGVPFEQIQPALYNIFSSMEIGAKDAEKVLKVFAKAAVAGQTDIQNASTATIGILNAFHLPLSSLNHLMDVQFQLVKEGIGTYDEWSQRIGLVTPSAVRFGQSVDMMAAALAASTRMGISAARSATAVSRAMDAMSNPKAVAALKELGIASYDAHGKFRPMIDILQEFRTKLEKIPNKDRIKAILDVFKGAGGTVEARRFLQNMLLTPGNLELFRNILGGMKDSAGSFEQAYAIMADTVATKSELLSNKWQEVKIAAGKALIPIFMAIVNWFIRLFDWFNKLSPQTKKWIVVIIAVGAALGVLMGILLLLASVILGFVAALAVVTAPVLATIGVIAAIVVAIMVLIGVIVYFMIKNKAFREVMFNIGRAIGKAFMAVVDAIKASINWISGAISWLATNIPAAWKWISDTTVSIWNSIVQFFVGLWNSIIGFFKGAWQVMVVVFQTFIAIIVAIWKDFWDSGIGKLVRAYVDLVIAIIRFFVYSFIFIIEWAVKGVMIAWNWLWNGIAEVVKAVWAVIGPYIIAAWNNIVLAAKVVWAILSTGWNNTWNTIKLVVTYIWNTISSMLSGAWSTITKIATVAWAGLKTAIVNPLKDAMKAVGDFGIFIFNFFKGAGTWLLEAGKAIIMGLVHGIENAFHWVVEKINSVTQWIKDHLPFSPAKRGPLSGRGNPFYSGQAIVRLIGQGMASKMHDLDVVMMGVSSSVRNMTGGLSGNVASGNTGGGYTTNQNITVNTQEINPVRHAAELGWLLAGRS